MEEKSILEMARGAIAERADYEMARIIENILDPNTMPTKKRTLTITIDITPDMDRRNLVMSCTAKSKLEATNPVSAALYVTNGEVGSMSVVELVPQVPGQMSMMGDEQKEPVKLRSVSGGNEK